MSSVLITGGAGFVYSHVARYFVQQGWEVTIADHFDMQGKGRNIQDIVPQVRLLIGDMSTGALAERCASLHADYVVHAAAYTHVDDAILHPERFMLNNSLGTTRLLQALWEAGPPAPQKILIVSTDEVYGSTPPGLAFAEETPYNPSNAYAASKVAVEAITRAFYLTHQLPLLVMRPCNTYGPGQYPSKVIPKFVQQMLTAQPVTLYNDGLGSRDWLHVDDHARAVRCLLEAGLPGEAYNLGADEEHTDREIAERIASMLLAADVLATAPTITLTPGRPGHDRRYRMATGKLRALGWVPHADFAEQFRETVRWNVAQQGWWSDDLVTLDAPSFL